MDHKVVVITGAGSGLGASLAKKYSNRGSHVCLLGRTESKLKKVAEQLSESCSIYAVDVTDKSAVANVINAIKEEVGSVDLLINNAGTGVYDLAENINEEAVHRMIDINLKGTIFCTQEILPDMKKRNQGTIVNVVSTAGLEGKVTESVYCASKFGVRGFTESLVLELDGTGVRVFGAYMGGMRSPFWDGILPDDVQENLMDTDDIADIIIENAKVRKNLLVTEVIIKNKK